MSGPNYKTHVFICTAKKDGECCADKKSVQLQEDLKSAAKERWGKSVRINKAGCLGQCSNGIAAVFYPQNEWHLNLTSSAVDKLLQQISDKID